MRSCKTGICLAVVAVVVLFSGSAKAHFGMLIPSDTMVMQEDSHTINVTLSFSHPMEMVGMELEKPNVFAVSANGKNQSLLDHLKPARVMDHAAWTPITRSNAPVSTCFTWNPSPTGNRPRTASSSISPKPWSPPSVMTRAGMRSWVLKPRSFRSPNPTASIKGNVFQGIVKVNGKPVPYAAVEVEYYNQDKASHAPTEYMVTQTIKADGNGVFTYATPDSGWWGFAALNTADFRSSMTERTKTWKWEP